MFRSFIVHKGVVGYIVNIGCQTAGFSKPEELIAALTEYIKDPEGTEAKYYKQSEGLIAPPGISTQCDSGAPAAAPQQPMIEQRRR